MSGMRGGNDKLFADKRCVLAASNIPYRATSKDIIEFLSDFDIREECIRRRYNQKGQPTADAKIAFASQEAAMKALKIMNKKTICGRQVFLKPV
jgi:RNA recognition motif-containing protein